MKSGIKKIGNFPTVTAKEYLQLSRNAIEEIAETSKNHFLEGFRQGGGQTDDSKSGWKANKAGSTILVKSGDLRRDIDIKSISKNQIIIGTNRIPYAAIHNEGLKVPDRVPVHRKALKFTVGGRTIFRKRAKGFTMPKREFIGHSRELNEKNMQIIIKTLNTVLKPKK